MRTFKEFILLTEADAPPPGGAGSPPPGGPPAGGAPAGGAPAGGAPPPDLGMGGAPAGGAPPPDLGGSPTDLGGGGLSGTTSPTTKAEKIDSNDPWELLQAWVDQLGKEEKLLKQAKKL